MNSNLDGGGRRILLADDNPATHQDFRKVFARRVTTAAALSTTEVAVFGTAQEGCARRPLHWANMS